MTDKKMLKKTIKESLQPFAKEHNFTFTKPLLLTRHYGSVVHIINFDLPMQGFNCNIAIQPLYVPADTINLSFGNRLNHFKAHLSGVWGYGDTKEEILQDLDEVIKLLETNALPWFQEVGNVQGIISFIKEGKVDNTNMIIGFPPYLKSIYLGFSYLYIEKYELAENALSDVYSIFKDDNRTWVVELKELIDSMRSLVKNNPHEVSERLGQFIKQTKDNNNLK